MISNVIIYNFIGCIDVWFIYKAFVCFLLSIRHHSNNYRLYFCDCYIYIIELILKGHIDFFSVSHKQASNLCHKFEKKVAKNKRGKNNKDI